MKFLVCDCSPEVFEMVIATSPVVGTNERFVVPMEVYFDDQSDEIPFWERHDEMAQLGIYLYSIV